MPKALKFQLSRLAHGKYLVPPYNWFTSISGLVMAFQRQQYKPNYPSIASLNAPIVPWNL